MCRITTHPHSRCTQPLTHMSTRCAHLHTGWCTRLCSHTFAHTHVLTCAPGLGCTEVCISSTPRSTVVGARAPAKAANTAQAEHTGALPLASRGPHTRAAGLSATGCGQGGSQRTEVRWTRTRREGGGIHPCSRPTAELGPHHIFSARSVCLSITCAHTRYCSIVCFPE